MGKFPRRTSTRDFHVVFKFWTFDFVIKLCRQQAEVVRNHENADVRNIGQVEVHHGKYRCVKPGGVRTGDRSRDEAAFLAKDR